MIRAWRLIKANHADEAFTGEGARRWGGRWNSKGVRIIYTAESLSLATLEIMVHTPSYKALKNYVCIPIDFNPRLSQSISIEDLPDNWRADPIPESVQIIGDQWVENQQSLILKVPSALIGVEYNYLINPSHADFKKLVIHSPQKFTFTLDPLEWTRNKDGSLTLERTLPNRVTLVRRWCPGRDGVRMEFRVENGSVRS